MQLQVSSAAMAAVVCVHVMFTTEHACSMLVWCWCGPGLGCAVALVRTDCLFSFAVFALLFRAACKAVALGPCCRI